MGCINATEKLEFSRISSKKIGSPGVGGVLRAIKDRFIESRIYVAQLPTKSVFHFGSRSDRSIPAQAITPGPGGEERLPLVRVRGPGAECIDLV